MKHQIFIAVRSTEAELITALPKLLTHTDYEILLSPDLELTEAHFIITDTKFLKTDQENILTTYSHKVFLLSNESDEHNVNHFLSKYPLNHLIGLNSNHVLQELATHLKKQITSHIWGIDQYLSNDKKCSTTEVTNAKNIPEQIEQLLDQFDYSDNFDSPKDYLRLMANELLTNAFYHHHGKDLDRKTNIENQKVLFQVGRDQHLITMSVQDNSGLLNREKLIAPLQRGFQEKTPEQKTNGAKLGLYLTFQHSNQLILNYKKNEKTEVICIIDCNKRFKKYRERITSFHYTEEV